MLIRADAKAVCDKRTILHPRFHGMADMHVLKIGKNCEKSKSNFDVRHSSTCIRHLSITVWVLLGSNPFCLSGFNFIRATVTQFKRQKLLNF